jgi:hypothetical protein
MQSRRFSNPGSAMLSIFSLANVARRVNGRVVTVPSIAMETGESAFFGLKKNV